MNSIPFVLALSTLGKADLAIAGGKGANLGELTQAGFPVPPGFVVTTQGYDSFISSNRLEEVLAQGARKDLDGAAIRDHFERASIPPGVAQDILSAYRSLDGSPVAVRSSATAEDLPQAAFAGQQDTYLNVVGPEALLAAVRRCWASLWTDRAIQYRERLGVDPSTVKLAVVIQLMAPAEAAGVMFTANPVTGERGELVIDASPGLGEAVVSGLVTPDHTVLRSGRLGWRIVEQAPGRREVVIHPLPGGGTQRVVPEDAPATPALPQSALFRLAKIGRAIARHFGQPQDVEWSLADRQLYILQSRPITALPDPPSRSAGPVKMLAGMFAEMFPVRPYPLDQTTWVPAISDAATAPIFSLIGLSVPSLTHFFNEEEGVVVQFSGKVGVRPTPGILLAPFRLLFMAMRYDPLRWQSDPLLAEGRTRAQNLSQLEVKTLTLNDLLVNTHEALDLTLLLAGEIRRRYYPRSLLDAGLLRVVLAFLGRSDLYGDLLSTTGSLTLEANRKLEQLARRVRSDPTLVSIFQNHPPAELPALLEHHPAGISFLAEFHAFLERFGHREVVLSTVLQPTWQDDPVLVLGMVKGLAASTAIASNPRPAAEAALDAVLTHPLLGAWPLRAAFIRLVRTSQRLWQVREDTHFYATLVLPILRRTFLEMGRRMVGAGVLDACQEIFHLKLAEVEALAAQWPPTEMKSKEIRDLVQLRKEKRAALEGTPLVDPRLYRQEMTSANEGDVLLRGTPGSPGVIVGPVRVVHGVEEFDRLLAGEVLVAPFTNPSWTPLFQRACAVVVDGGAAGSHAAIVAREYGIPAVMGVINGTQCLVDGQRVRVDGSRGLVVKTAS